jgi:hypothetical protein
MSSKLMNRAWEIDAFLHPSERFVLMSIADFADDDGNTGPLSIEQLMRKSFQSRSGVKRALAKFEAAGFVTKIPYCSVTGSTLPNGFCVKFPSDDQARELLGPARPEEEEGGEGSTMDPRGSTGRTSISTEVFSKKTEVNTGVTVVTRNTPELTVRLGSRPLPKDFGITPELQEWAQKNGFKNLHLHLEWFTNWAKARGKRYVDWDACFRNAVRGNWAGLSPTDHKNVVAI